MTSNYSTLSDDRHSLLCVSEILKQVIYNDGKDMTGAAELADRSLREVIDRMGAVEDAERGGTPRLTSLQFTLDEPLTKLAQARDSLFLLSEAGSMDTIVANSIAHSAETISDALKAIDAILENAAAQPDPAAIIPEPGKEHFFATPYGTAQDGAFAAEMRERMEALEESYKNAPRITADRLEGWQNDTRSVSNLVYGARETVDLLTSEERDMDQYYGPLVLIANALDKAEDELSSLCGSLGDAKKATDETA